MKKHGAKATTRVPTFGADEGMEEPAATTMPAISEPGIAGYEEIAKPNSRI